MKSLTAIISKQKSQSKNQRDLEQRHPECKGCPVCGSERMCNCEVKQ